jgi:hypothetical protein
MATFTGTIKEFHDYFGPRIRNVVNGITRKHRLAHNGVCEFCSNKAELQSAHVHGKDRRTIIEAALKPFETPSGEVACDLTDIESKIIDAHMPIEDTFKFICHPCHVKYDSNNSSPVSTGGKQHERKPDSPEFTKISRIQLWAQRPHQANHKFIRAYLSLEKAGCIDYDSFKKKCIEEYQINGFDGHFASLKTDAGNSHGAVFYEKRGQVLMWQRVRDEVRVYFK